MIETLLQIQKYIYPFEEKVTRQEMVKVEDVQHFSDIKHLQQKKSEMQIKSKLLDSHYLVRLLKIYQEQLTLHYIYQYVPYSLKQYVQTFWIAGKEQKNGASSKVYIKKFSSELMMLISYLVWNKIEVDLCPANLGLTQQGKLKLFMSAKCRMGHKTELSLVAHYNNCKEKILCFVDKLLQNGEPSKQEEIPNFVIKGNKLVFPEQQVYESFYQNEQSFRNIDGPEECQSGIFNSQLYNNNQDSPRKYSTSSCINQPQHGRNTFMRQSQTPRYGKSSNFSQAKFSARGSRKRKNHKNSFQFGTNTPRAQRMSTSGCDPSEDKDDAKSFTHSRSIRIEFQQKTNPNQKKKRKDSYKVKVTSFHEYQMDDCDPKDLFGKNPEGNEDIFQHFTKKAQNFAKKQPEPSQQEEDYEQYDDLQEPIPFVPKKSMPEQGYAPTTTSSVHNLSEKVRLAKEKASNLLNKYMKTKKMSSFGQ